MAVERVYIYSADPIEALSSPPAAIRIFDEVASNRVIRIVEQGKPGPTGPPGTGQVSEPFYTITAGRLYATTSSLAIFNTFSSSLLPFTSSVGESSLSIGSLVAPWKSIYLSTASLFFTAQSESYLEVRADRNKLIIGSSFVETASFGFDSNRVIVRNTATDIKLQLTGSIGVIGDGSKSVMLINSGAFSALEVDSSGIVRLGDFGATPLATAGGIIFSGSNLYLGV